MEIVTYPDERLRKSCRRVKEGQLADVLLVAAEMGALARQHEAQGIAAPQVGDQRRFVLIESADDEDGWRLMINPLITYRSADTELAPEGCLSFPGQFAYVRRPLMVRVRYLNRVFSEHSQLFERQAARTVVHEIDHLNGVLISDYAERLF